MSHILTLAGRCANIVSECVDIYNRSVGSQYLQLTVGGEIINSFLVGAVTVVTCALCCPYSSIPSC